MNKIAQAKEKNVPRILFEILVYGSKKNETKVRKALDELQSQISKGRTTKNRVRVLWYVDNDEKTTDEKKQWLKENAKCKYYLILNDDYSVPKNYVKDTLSKIRVFEKSLKSLKTAGVCVAQKSNDMIENAEIIES